MTKLTALKNTTVIPANLRHSGVGRNLQPTVHNTSSFRRRPESPADCANTPSFRRRPESQADFAKPQQIPAFAGMT